MEKKIDKRKTIRIVLCQDGSVKFPWWTPEVEKIIESLNLKKLDIQSSKFCG